MKPHLQFGYVSRAHGLDGEIVVRTFDPASTVLEEIERVLVRTREGVEREYELAGVREGPKGDLLVSLKGVRRREDSERLTGSAVFAFREDLEAPADDEVFQGDLVGLEVFSVEGKRLGVVDGLFSPGPVPNVVIKDGDRELMLPLVDDFVKEIDLAAGRMVVVPIELEE